MERAERTIDLEEEQLELDEREEKLEEEQFDLEQDQFEAKELAPPLDLEEPNFGAEEYDDKVVNQARGGCVAFNVSCFLWACHDWCILMHQYCTNIASLVVKSAQDFQSTCYLLVSTPID